MAENIITHPVADNKLLAPHKETQRITEYTALGVSKIIVGIENPDRREILQDKETGLNYSRTAVEAKEIYCLKTQKHSPWFILDLETGQNGWYPGCEIHGDTIPGHEVAIRSKPSSEAPVIKRLSNASVVILEIDTLDQEPYDKGWYKILYDVKGYIKQDELTNLRYTDPNRI
jgi:hypothetical protein